MILHKIQMQGFRTFQKRQEIKLPTEPGLYLVRGKNLVDSALEGNDVGKSTLWSAVHWCFYGVTDRGLKAGNVISWGEDQAQVKVELEIAGEIHSIFRQQAPNELRIDDVLVSQESVNALLGYNAVEFLHSVLIGQFANYFMDLGPAEKLALFSDVLGLGYWEDRAEETRKKVAAQEQDMVSLVNRLEKEKGRLEALREREKALVVDRDAWEAEHKSKTHTLSGLVEKLRREHYAVQGKCDMALAGRNRLKLSVQEHYESLMTSRAELGPAARQLAGIESDLKHNQCPFCKRPLGSGWRERLESDRNNAALAVKQIKRVVGGGERLVAQLRTSLFSAEDIFSGLKKRLDALVFRLSQIEKELAIEKELTTEDQNPYTAHLDALRRDLSRSKATRRFLDAKRNQAATTQARLVYWVKGFRDLRLWVMDSTLAELEMHCNNGLLQLGLDRWSIKLDVERENKSGGVTKGFLVRVGQPGCDDVPWRAIGGGVTQRLRLTAQAGIADMINNRKQNVPGLEVWDEPDAHMSRQGVRDMIGCLQSRARALEKQIWIVTHRGIDFPFDGEMVVTKTLDGSTVTVL